MSKLQDRRLEAGLTQWQLAIKTEIPITTIQKYESGKSPIDGAKLKTLLILARSLNCKLIDIIEDSETIKLLEDNIRNISVSIKC